MGSRRMTRKRRAQRRAMAERRDNDKQHWREKNKKERIDRAGWVREIRSRYDRVSRRTIEDLFEKDWRRNDAVYPCGFEKFATALRYLENREFRSKLRSLLITLSEQAPDLIAGRYYASYINLTTESWLRPLDDWKTRGKSDGARFKSLVDHLLVKYTMPEFLYQLVRIDHDGWNGISFFARVAKGTKVTNCFNGFFLGVPMTKRMCHYFMQMPAGTPFFAAVRNAQVKTLGGDKELARALNGTFLGRGTVRDEDFWLTVTRWFCEQPDVKYSQVGPLLDYIKHRHSEDPDFSLRGRTVRSLTRNMKEWHRQLTIEEKLHGIKFKPSGFKEGIWELKGLHGNTRFTSIWTMEELLTSKALHAEGKAMKHCVYTYVDDIKNGDCSIWSLKNEGTRALTVEAWNSKRLIVQARGKCNRDPKRYELSVLNRWALENELKVDV